MLTLRCWGTEQNIEEFHPFLNTLLYFQGSNLIGQINILMTFLNLVKNLCGQWLPDMWHKGATKKRGSSSFLCFARPFTSFQFSMWNALQLHWDQVTDSNVAEHATSLPSKVLSCFCSMLWIYLHRKAPSNQLCCIWLNLSTIYISQSVCLFSHNY